MLVLFKEPGLLHSLAVTVVELAAVTAIELEQQLAHGSPPDLMEQSDIGEHTLHTVAD